MEPERRGRARRGGRGDGARNGVENSRSRIGDETAATFSGIDIPFAAENIERGFRRNDGYAVLFRKGAF